VCSSDLVIANDQSPVKMQITDGTNPVDLGAIFSAQNSISLRSLQLQYQAASQVGAAGFIPIEIPLFLGA
jgi:hypothetical protein